MKIINENLSKFITIGWVIIFIANCDTNVGATERRLTSQTWMLEKYLRNDIDDTNQINLNSYEETYLKNGEFERSYTHKDGGTTTETGTWNFKNNETEIHVSDISSIQDFSQNNSTLSSSIFNIVQLTDDQFHYNYINGGDEHEFRLIPK
jgi:predicted oxidoreductase